MEYVVVQAGGRGARLEYLTENKPKALVPVKNLPMLFHLFRKYPDKRFIIIADYRKDVLREYLAAFAQVKYQVVEAQGNGTCAGIREAMELLPEKQPFMLTWCDLILPDAFSLPKEYVRESVPENDYIGISGTFPCRWKYSDGIFTEQRSTERGVAGLFLFRDKRRLERVPSSGELVRWMGQNGMRFQDLDLSGTEEFGVLEKYEELGKEKCRPFNRTRIEGDIFIKEPVDAQGERLAERECAWYRMAMRPGRGILPHIYGEKPLTMEYIRGKNIYECHLSYEEKRILLVKLVEALKRLHRSESVPADSFSMKEAYFNKTMDRLGRIEDLVPFARKETIRINGKQCRNVFFYKRELERKLEKLKCEKFYFIHGDCTFSNWMLRDDGSPVLIDPRGYFGYTKFYGDVRYDWAKLYYSIVGNYDRFNVKDFRLKIGETDVSLAIQSNGWEDMEEEFFKLTGADREEIRLLHAVIWLSLTTYAWQDYDSLCGAFYNGLTYLEDLL